MITKDRLKNYITILDYIYINRHNIQENLKIIQELKLSLQQVCHLEELEFISKYFPKGFFNKELDQPVIELSDYELNIIIRCFNELISIINRPIPRDFVFLLFPLNQLFRLLVDGKSVSDWLINNHLGVYRLESEKFLIEEERKYLMDLKPSLTVNIRDIVCYCEYRHYGRILEQCGLFFYRFTNKVYGIVNRFGEGAWALSYTLAGRHKEYKKFDVYESDIWFSDQEMNLNQLKSVSCYVDNYPLEFTKREFKRKNLLYFLNKAKQNNPHFKDDLNDIIKFFNLDHFTDRNINHLGTRFINATIAIGYVQGKKIFCFPWISDLERYEKKIFWFSQFLKEKGCIVIIPTDDKKAIKNLVDEIVDMRSVSLKHYYNSPFLYSHVSNIEKIDDQYIKIYFDNGFIKKLNKKILIEVTKLLLKGNIIKDIKINDEGYGIIWNNDKSLILTPGDLWLECEDI